MAVARSAVGGVACSGWRAHAGGAGAPCRSGSPVGVAHAGACAVGNGGGYEAALNP